jgi:hypothetical protein
MSFTRVEQNGVEFYTLNATGESGMSIRGLARLCNVDDKTVSQLLRNSVRGLTRSKRLEALKDKEIYCGVRKARKANVIRAEVCGIVIGYYAFESRQKTAEAQYAFEKFAIMGIEGWIQNITGWKSGRPMIEATPESVIQYINAHLKPNLIAASVDVEGVIEIIKEAGFSATGLRIYFYLEMKMLQEEEPTLSTICADLNISPATFKKWLPQIQEWSGVAHWLDLTKRQGPERAIQERLHQELGGEMEAWTAIGPVDLVTPTEIIEIKRIEDWKTAVGQVLTKSQTYPQHKKRIHLFGESSQQLKKIISNCQAFEVVVTFERLNLKTAAT